MASISTATVRDHETDRGRVGICGFDGDKVLINTGLWLNNMTLTR